jgi:outer membrane protein assembly factor BamB
MSLCEACIEAAQAERRAERRDREEEAARPRSVDQLIFVGLNGYALALDRDTGRIVWSNGQMRSGYVSLLLDGDRLLVSTNGYIYCLDPLTGQILWHNPLTGYGLGAPAHLTSVRGQSSQAQVQQAAGAEAARRRGGQAGPPAPGA